MNSHLWTTDLHTIYDNAVSRYRGGQRDDGTYFSPEEVQFLASIGLKPINVYDYVEDFVTWGEPDWETFLLIAAVRRDYFLFEQKGVDTIQEIRPEQLPSKRATLAGIPWLPRIIKKARCLLEGALCHDIMYCCGGDRHFLRLHMLHAADFLRVVWISQGDDQKILESIKQFEQAGRAKT